MSNKKKSPFKFVPALIGGIVSTGFSIWGAVKADQEKKKAARKAKEAKKEMNRLKDIYANLDTSNPYLNMENTMEDLTVNQQQAEFQRQTFQQGQANIMSGLRGAAGGSGIAALAQSLSRQGQIAAQQTSASICQQEASNIRAERQMASQIQGMERQGEVWSRSQEKEKQSTLLGMAQQETAAYQAQVAQAEQAKWAAISSGAQGFTSMVAGFGGGATAGGGGGLNIPEGYSLTKNPTTTTSDRRLKKNIKLIGSSPSGLKIYIFEYINKIFGKGVYQGVMSDEVPQFAVIQHEDGYDMVDYSKLDVEFKEII